MERNDLKIDTKDIPSKNLEGKLDSKDKDTDLSLEEIVRITNLIGLKYAEAKKEFDRLDLFKTVIKARISMRIEETTSEKLTEVKLKRLTETDSEYISYLEKLLEAKNSVENLKIRYDSYKNLFEAKRSSLSYQKAELKLL